MKKLFILPLYFAPALLFSMQQPPTQPTLRLTSPKSNNQKEVLEDCLEMLGNFCCANDSDAYCRKLPVGCILSSMGYIASNRITRHFICIVASESKEVFQECTAYNNGDYILTSSAILGVGILGYLAKNYADERKAEREKLKKE